MRKTKPTDFLLRSVAISALCTGMALGAYAQDAGDDAEEPVLTTDTGTADEGEDLTQEVVRVTGSRLANEYTSIAPLDIISADAAALEGIADVGKLLQTATVAAGSPQVTAATSSAFVQDGGIGTETVSLRGLGANRTLVLLNGRRAGPAGTRGAVSSFDLNAIPLSAVQNIEILKDGASSIYGSDAVAGVVNIITKKDDVSELDLFYSAPENSGGEQLRVSGAWGKAFDKGNLLLTFDYNKQEELARGDRSYFSCGEDYVYNRDGTRADFVDPRTGNYACSDLAWGHVWMYNYLGAGAIGRPWQGRPQLLQYDYDGSLAANGLAPWGTNDFGLDVPAGWFPVGYGELLLPGATPDAEYGPTAQLSESLLNADHPFQDQESLIPEIERTTFYANGDYELTDSATLYGEVLLNRRETYVNGYRQFWQYDYAFNYFGYLYTNNPNLEANGFTAAPLEYSYIGLSPTAITDHADDKITVDYVNVVGGVTGDFGAILKDWNYDFFVQYSKSDGEYVGDVIYDDAITPYQYFNIYGSCANDPDGVTDVRGVPCITPDWYNPEFLAGNISAEDRAFLFGVDVGNTEYEQTQIEAFIDGPLFEMPAGTVNAGFGVSYIDESILDVPGETSQIGNAWGSSSAGITEGSKETTAIFAELGIPLVKDAPWAEALDLSLSARYTDVDVYGSDTTYKAGLGWQITPSVRARTTFGTSFRAPALFELYLADQSDFLGQRFIDPCINWGANLANGAISQRVADNCATDNVPATHNGSGSSATIFSAGNAGNLEAETSEAFTAGIIWAPEFLDFRMAIDYFDIQIDDQIAQLGAANILLGCYGSDDFANEPLCDLFDRNQNFLVNTVTDNYINIAEQSNRGIDITAEYTRDFSFGTLRLDTQHTFQLEDKILLFPTSPILDTNGETGDPEWVGEFNATFDHGPWQAFWGVDFVGPTSNIESYGGSTLGTYFGTPVFYKLETETTVYHSASISRELPHGIDVRFGVSNLFDEHPPAVTTLNLGEYNTVGTSAFESQYDWLGRRFFINVTKTF